MRALTLGAIVAAALATAASAQTDFEGMHGARMHRLNSLGVPGRPFAGMAQASQDWIAAETVRQTQAPKPLTELALTVDKSLRKDILQVARAHELDTHDIVLAIILQITRDAETATADALKAARGSGDAAAIQAAAEKAAVATELRKQALQVQTDASLELTRN